MFFFDFLINFIRQNENDFLFNYFPFITDWFLVFCVLFLLFLFIFYSYDILFLLKSIILVLLFDLLLLLLVLYYFQNGFFSIKNVNSLLISDNALFLNNLSISSELVLLKILIVFISLLFFLIRFVHIQYYPSTTKEGLNYVLYKDRSSLKNIVIFYVFVLIFSVMSILFLLSSNNFLLAYLCLELFSLCSMILIGSSSKMFDVVNLLPLKSQIINNNLLWSLNYLLVSALGSSIFLLGVSYLYGHTGSINFCEIKLFFLNLSFNSLILNFENISLLLSLFLILLGLLIKGGFAPFHYWIFELYKNLPYYLLTYFCYFQKLL